MADFLLEIGCEEIPARMLDAGAEELARRVGTAVCDARLQKAFDAQGFSTPRRLAVLLRDVQPQQPDEEEEVLGPAVKIAYKDGQATAAAHAFAKKVGMDLDAPGVFVVAVEHGEGRRGTTGSIEQLLFGGEVGLHVDQAVPVGGAKARQAVVFAQRKADDQRRAVGRGL